MCVYLVEWLKANILSQEGENGEKGGIDSEMEE